MKNITWFVLLVLCSCTTENKPVNFSGETAYLRDKTESMNTKLKDEYKFKIYEDQEKKWETHVTGTVITDYDHLSGEVKNSTFTTFGVDF